MPRVNLTPNIRSISSNVIQMNIIEQITDFKESLIDKYIVPMKASNEQICIYINEREKKNKTPKRLFNPLWCPGNCFKNCSGTLFRDFHDYRKHIGCYRRKCNVCKAWCVDGSAYYKHFRKQHEHKLNKMFASLEFNIPEKISPMQPPKGFVKRTFFFIKEVIKSCYWHDKRRIENIKKKIEENARISKKGIDRIDILNNYLSCIDFFPSSNQKLHDLAIQWYNYLNNKNRFGTFLHEYGGMMQYCFKNHSGMYKFSLDRINNDMPHFVSNNPFENMRDVPLILNTSCNPLNNYSNFLKECLKREKLIHVDSTICDSKIVYTSIYNAWNRERLFNGKKEKHILREKYKKFDIYKNKCIEKLKDQSYRCAISNGFLDVKEKSGQRCFAPSLDCFPSTEPHYVENVRWIWAWLNYTNCERLRNYADSKDEIMQITSVEYKKFIS